ncbi:14851_t:CDS:1, partial [Gigaspora margarita]
SSTIEQELRDEFTRDASFSNQLLKKDTSTRIANIVMETTKNKT